MSYCVVAMTHVTMHVVIALMNVTSRTERAVVVMMMESVAVMPVPVMCPAAVYVPPTRVITPVPRTMPSVPCVAPEPIVDNGSIYIYRFDDVVRTIDVLIAYYLNADLVGRFIFLYIDRCNILIDIFGKDSLQNDESFVSFAGLYDA